MEINLRRATTNHCLGASACPYMGLRSRMSVPGGTPISWQASFGILAHRILVWGSPWRKAVETSEMNSFHIEHVAIAKRHCLDDLANVGDDVFNSPWSRSGSPNPWSTSRALALPSLVHLRTKRAFITRPQSTFSGCSSTSQTLCSKMAASSAFLPSTKAKRSSKLILLSRRSADSFTAFRFGKACAAQIWPRHRIVWLLWSFWEKSPK